MPMRPRLANAALVAGATVLLESDVSDTDRFGRLLRYVWVEGDGDGSSSTASSSA